MLFTIGAVLGNGILAPNLRHELTTPLILIPELNIDFSVGGAWWAMLWSMFGYYEPSTLGYQAPSTSVLAPAWQWAYMVVVALLLVNVLIAMFVRTYCEAMEDAELHWRLKRAATCRRYALAPLLPPPLNFFEALGRRRRRDSPKTTRSAQQDAAYKLEHASEVESRALQRLLQQQRQLQREPELPFQKRQTFQKGKTSEESVWDALTTTRAHASVGRAVPSSAVPSQRRDGLVKRTSLSPLPSAGEPPTTPPSEPAATEVLHTALDGFGGLLTESLHPLISKVEQLDSTLHSMQVKLGMLPGPVKPGQASADPRGTRVSSYLHGAHALSSHAYRPPPGALSIEAGSFSSPTHSHSHRSAPAMPSAVPSTMGAVLSGAVSDGRNPAQRAPGTALGAQLAKAPLPPLPPPKSTDAGPEPYPEDILQAFHKYDRDKSGGIDVAQLRACLESLGVPCDIAEAQRLHAEYDEGAMGELKVDELSQLVSDVRAQQAIERRRGRQLAALSSLQGVRFAVEPERAPQPPVSTAKGSD